MEIASLAQTIILLSRAFRELSAGREKDKPRLVIDDQRTEASLSAHQADVARWASEISLRDLPFTRQMDDLYVELSLVAGTGAARTQENHRVPPTALLKGGRNTLILGGPGAGKTTTVRYLCHTLLRHESLAEDDTFQFPLLLRLRELKHGESITSHLLATLGVRVDFAGDAINTEGAKYDLQLCRERTLSTYLNTSRPLLFLDGLDELHVDDFGTVCNEISRIARSLTHSAIIATCRLGADQVSIDGCDKYVLQPFSTQQLQRFTEKWFTDKHKPAQFLSCLASKPYASTAHTPLHAANLCIIFDAEGDLPPEHTRVYEKIIQVRLREWDRERNIHRQGRYKRFGTDEKHRFLSLIAFEIAKNGHGASFTLAAFRRAYTEALVKFDLPPEDAKGVLDELESHTGLIQGVGFDTYEFYHKTVQEYLCAEYLSRMPVIPKHYEFIKNLPDACAIAATLSALPDTFVAILWFTVFESRRGLIAQHELAGVANFWSRLCNRAVTERVRFQGTEPLAVAMLAAVSFVRTHSRTLGRDAFTQIATPLTDAILQVAEIPRVMDAMSRALRLYTFEPIHRNDAMDGGIEWLKFTTPNRSIFDDSTGSLNAPRELYIPKSLVDALTAVAKGAAVHTNPGRRPRPQGKGGDSYPRGI